MSMELILQARSDKKINAFTANTAHGQYTKIDITNVDMSCDLLLKIYGLPFSLSRRCTNKGFKLRKDVIHIALLPTRSGDKNCYGS